MIKYLILDIDGSITDGKIYIGNSGELFKAFSVKDGYAINYILKPVGIKSIIVTARDSDIVCQRCRELGIEDVHQGVSDKLAKLVEVIGQEEFMNCAYFGDDIPDLRCMHAIKDSGGYVGCPADAAIQIKEIASYVCNNKAGNGAMREFSEWLVSDPNHENEIAKRVAFSIGYLENLYNSKGDLKTGTNCVNDFFSYSVLEYTTRSRSLCELKSHQKNIDIQWIVEGEEIIEVAETAKLCERKGYSESDDVTIWHDIENMMQIKMVQGNYIVLYPNNAHVEGIMSGGQRTFVKKIVGKVSIDF